MMDKRERCEKAEARGARHLEEGDDACHGLIASGALLRDLHVPHLSLTVAE